LFGYLYEILDLTPAASLAIIDVMGKPYRTVVDLKTVGKEDENPLRFSLLCLHQPVVHADDRVLEHFLFALPECGNKHKNRVKDLQNNATEKPTKDQNSSLLSYNVRGQTQPRSWIVCPPVSFQ